MKIAIIGTAGLPANYGGFETLTENLVVYHSNMSIPCELVVFCSGKDSIKSPINYYNAKLIYINIRPNGISSIMYDVVSIISAIHIGCDLVLILGVSGAIILPFVRLLSKIRIITNIDGVEWKRQKWSRLAKIYLRFSEWIAVKHSDTIIADNVGIYNHISEYYDRRSQIIEYGGDHAISSQPTKPAFMNLPEKFSLSISRIEPENNIDVILEAFSESQIMNLVAVGNWDSSPYGLSLKEKFSNIPNIYLIDPIYDISNLHYLRNNCEIYIHGHSAGGTNPSLVEMMFFRKTIIAYDCVFNRSTTENCCLYFSNVRELNDFIVKNNYANFSFIGDRLYEIALRRYTWDIIGKKYFSLINTAWF